MWEELPGGEGTLRVDGARSQAQGFYVALFRKPGHANAAALTFEDGATEPQETVLEVPVSAPSGMQSAGQRNGRRAGRNRGDERAGKPVERPSGSQLPPESLAGATCNPDLLPPGRAVLYGEHVRFVPPQATALLPPGCIWQGSLLGKLCGGTLDAAPRRAHYRRHRFAKQHVYAQVLPRVRSHLLLHHVQRQDGIHRFAPHIV